MNATIRNLLLGAALLAGGVFAGHAIASGVPSVSPLTWSGVVTDDAGKPYPKAVPVSVAFYDGQNATTAACTSSTVQAQAGTGYFEVVLPAECVKAVHDSADLWSEMTVGDGKTVLPRSRVGAVPYALEAQRASEATGDLANQLAGWGAPSLKLLDLAIGQSGSITTTGTHLFLSQVVFVEQSGMVVVNGDKIRLVLKVDGSPVPVHGSLAVTTSYNGQNSSWAKYAVTLHGSVEVTPGKHAIELASEDPALNLQCIGTYAGTVDAKKCRIALWNY